MKRHCFFILIFLFFPILGFADFKELKKDSQALKSGFGFASSSLKVVQKRWLEKRFLSSVELAVSPSLKGFNYMDNYSIDLFYRFFLNDYWGFGLKYSYYFNPLNRKGKEEVEKRGRIPLELKHAPRRSYFGGVHWHPFYGKAVLYNHLVRFDLYLSAFGGKIELLNISPSAPAGFLAVGLVCWWHKNFNSRVEAQGHYYQYDALDDKTKEAKIIEEYFYKISLSFGVLF